MICLRFDLAAPTRHTAVFFLTFNTLVNIGSYFIVMGLFTVTEVQGDIGLFSVNISAVDTIDASRIDLYWFLSSHLPADLYIFLVFSRHLWLYKALLLNNWPIKIETICCFGRFECNSPLIMKLFSVDSISIIKSITLVNYLYLSYWDAWADFPSLWNKDSFSYGGILMMWLVLKNSFCIDRNKK